MRGVRPWLRRALPLAVSVSALTFLLLHFDFREALATIDARVAWTIVPALLVFGLVSLALEATSLTRLVPAGRLDTWTAARVKAASYLVYIVNYAIGAGALSILLRRRAAVPLADAAGLVALIAALDLGLLLGLCALSVALFEADQPFLRVGVAAATGLGLVGGLIVLRFPRPLGPFEVIRSMALFRAARTTSLPRLAELLMLRLLFVTAFIGVVAAALYAFEIVVPIGDIIIGVVAVTLVAALPIAVAGLGTGQAAFVYVFRQWASPEALLACSLVLSAGLILLRVAIGLAFAHEYAREAAHLARELEA